MERHGPIEAWIIDDTGFPKKGRHSVGVGRQYCGELGKQDNCQIAVTLSIANHHASLPAAYRLYLPKEWVMGPYTSAQSRCAQGGHLQNQAGNRARAIALGKRGRPAARRGADGCRLLAGRHRSAYEHHGARIELCSRHYATNVGMGARHWISQPPKNWSGCGRPPKLLRRDGKHQPISVKKLAFALPSKAWRKITWREATAEPLSSRFARVRVRAAHRDYGLAES